MSLYLKFVTAPPLVGCVGCVGCVGWFLYQLLLVRSWLWLGGFGGTKSLLQTELDLALLTFLFSLLHVF
jgi:hypothetical protein